MGEEGLSVFTLVPVSIPREDLGDGAHRSAARFLDFVIDGRSLRRALQTDNVGVLSDDRESWNRELAQQLVFEPTIDPRFEGRAFIYGCRECLDVDCGGIVVEITRHGNRIRWANFAEYWPNLDYNRFELKAIGIGPYEFDFQQYRSTLERFLD